MFLTTAFGLLFIACATLNLYTKGEDVSVWPSTENDHSKLQIILPQSLQKPGGYLHQNALFGYPPYALGSLEIHVIALNSTLCEKTEKNTTWGDLPYAFFIERGGCHFVEKARNAQYAGAKALIISDNTCLCSDHECLHETQDTVCETVLPYMADDESGKDITIPSLLIRKSDGQNVKEELMKGTYVMAKVEWGVPSPDGRIEWTVWHSAWDEQTMKAFEEFQVIVEKLGQRAEFTPHFVSYNGSKVGCRPTKMSTVSSSLPCGNMCINKGRYCLLDPSPFHDQSVGASGADVLIENLRRKCIWLVINNRSKSKEVGGDDNHVNFDLKWWQYVNAFGKECNLNEETFMDKKCSKKVMERYVIDTEKVENCMGAYGIDTDIPNQLLDEELEEQSGLQLLRLPAVYVDGVHARGTLNGANVLSIICAAYGDHNPPEICSCVSRAPITAMECVKKGGYQKTMSAAQRKIHIGDFGKTFGILVLVAATVSAVGYVYWRHTQRHMREQVRSILAEYMPLEDLSGEQDYMPHRGKRKTMKSGGAYVPPGAEDLDEY